MSQKHTVGIIGCGKRMGKHIPGILADERLEVVALSDVKEEAATAMNEEHDFGGSIYTDYKKMLTEIKPEVVVTCLWTPLHLPVFKDCAEAGVKAVLSEKPMAPTWGECKEMGRVAEETGCQLTFSHQRRFAPGNLMVRKMLQEGIFGEIQRMDLYSPPNLLDCGTHTFDQAMSFNNESPAKWVLGAVDASNPIKWFDVHAEAMAIGKIVFENGVTAHFQVGGEDKSMGTGLRVHGTKGFIEVFWDGQIGCMAVYDKPGWRPEEPENPEDQVMIDYVKNAIDCMESGDEPELSHKKALRAAEIIFAIYESVRKRSRIELPISIEDNAFISMLEAGEFK
ncbi:MAG: Gfo/Idh/MocA family protein [Candidatus Sumerlaeia bacterium]